MDSIESKVNVSRFKITRTVSPNVELEPLTKLNGFITIGQTNSSLIYYIDRSRISLNLLSKNINLNKILAYEDNKPLDLLINNKELVANNTKNYRLICPLLNLSWKPLLVGNFVNQNFDQDYLGKIRLNYRAVLTTDSTFEPLNDLSSLQFINDDHNSYTFSETSLNLEDLYQLQSYDCQYIKMYYYHTDTNNLFEGLRLSNDRVNLPTAEILLVNENLIIVNTMVKSGKEIDIIIQPSNKIQIQKQNLIDFSDDYQYKIINFSDSKAILNLVTPLNSRQVLEANCSYQINNSTVTVTMILEARQELDFNCHMILG